MFRGNLFLKKVNIFMSTLVGSIVLYSVAWAEEVAIPANTRIYVETQEYISGKKKETREGQTIRSRVWRDVVVEGQTIIEAGTPVLVRVDSFKRAKVAGVKGKITLGAYETTLLDGNPIQLAGGYHKEGRGRMALSITLAAVIFLPLIFIKGKSAKLETGTVFDAYVDQRTMIDLPDYKKPSGTINLSGIVEEGFDVEVLYEELEAAEKPEVFAFAIQAPTGNSGEFVIDVLNGQKITPLELEASQTGSEGTIEFWRGEIKIKDLAKDLKKGINTFEISTLIDGARFSKEIILDIQI